MKTFKKWFFLLAAMFVGMFYGIAVHAEEAIDQIVAPTGFKAILVLVPLVLVLVLLYRKVDMIIAGLVAGILAMIIGGISLAEANTQLLEAVPTMLSITVPIINSAVAMAVFKAGSYTAALTLAKRGTKGKVEYVSAFIVILLAAATYMSGIGGGSAMVIAPLAFAAVGVVPELIAAMSLAAAVSFTTSPASLESSIVSKLGGFSVSSYVVEMRPFWLLFVVLAIALAFWGTKRRHIGFKASAENEYETKSNGELFKITLPAIFLLFAVIFGPLVNELIGFVFFTPLVYMVITLALIYLCTDFSMNQSVEAMVDGSTYILTRLFQYHCANRNVCRHCWGSSKCTGICCSTCGDFNRSLDWHSCWSVCGLSVDTCFASRRFPRIPTDCFRFCHNGRGLRKSNEFRQHHDASIIFRIPNPHFGCGQRKCEMAKSCFNYIVVHWFDFWVSKREEKKWIY